VCGLTWQLGKKVECQITREKPCGPSRVLG
jgi:hypothetical protein